MSPALPLVHLTLLKPFIEEMQSRNLDAAELLQRSGIPLDATNDPNQTVHVSVIHQLLEDLAEAVGDRHFAARVGGQMNASGWPPLVDAMKNARTLGGFLTRYVGQTDQIASSATQFLRLEGERASLGETRMFEPSIVPAQNDAFMAGLIMAILGRALGDRLDPSEITIVVSDPAALPPNFQLVQVIRGDRRGYRILFPTAWLSCAFDMTDYVKADADQLGTFGGQSGIVDDFRKVLRVHAAGGRLTADRAAGLVGMSRQKLARLLREQGTTISAELEFVRLELARKQLEGGNRPVGEIADALGFSIPANFSRAFSRAVGMSPRAYRAASRTSGR